MHDVVCAVAVGIATLACTTPDIRTTMVRSEFHLASSSLHVGMNAMPRRGWATSVRP